jgi:hypothetical protein
LPLSTSPSTLTGGQSGLSTAVLAFLSAALALVAWQALRRLELRIPVGLSPAVLVPPG